MFVMIILSEVHSDMIQTMKQTDLEAVMKLWLTANCQAHSFLSTSYWHSNFKSVSDALPGADVYVYKQNGTVLGFAGLTGGYLAGIFVSPDMQSKGIGHALMEQCKAVRETLTLHVYEKNQQALRFYLREGFAVQQRRTDELTKETELAMLWSNKI